MSVRKARAFMMLTKPTIILMVVVTGLAAFAAEGFLFREPLQTFYYCFALLLSAASANALNQCYEKDIDSTMLRTRKRRPLPMGELARGEAISFAISVGLIGNAYLFWRAPLAGVISFLTLIYYVFFYTMWLKPRHYYNIVIGGAAGATAPLIAWAAATGDLAWYPWLMFAVIFTWTPPHFWALALAVKEDYVNVKMPMLPVALGDRRTKIEIVIYTILLLPLSLVPTIYGWATWIYTAIAVLFWGLYMLETVFMIRKPSKSSYMRTFFFSLVYIFVIFLGMGVDGAWRYFFAV